MRTDTAFFGLLILLKLELMSGTPITWVVWTVGILAVLFGLVMLATVINEITENL